jgi:hypothetical protein
MAPTQRRKGIAIYFAIAEPMEGPGWLNHIDSITIPVA